MVEEEVVGGDVGEGEEGGSRLCDGITNQASKLYRDCELWNEANL